MDNGILSNNHLSLKYFHFVDNHLLTRGGAKHHNGISFCAEVAQPKGDLE